MGSGASAPDPCLAGFFALRCFSLITIWVTPESWAVKPITSLPHWFYTRILRVPKCFSPQAFRLIPKSAHNLGITTEGNRSKGFARAAGPAAVIPRSCDEIIQVIRIIFLEKFVNLHGTISIFLGPPASHIEIGHFWLRQD